MLTSFEVKCPHVDCHWSGSLIPKLNRDPELTQTNRERHRLVRFVCPHCRGEWFGRMVGDDVRMIPLELATV